MPAIAKQLFRPTLLFFVFCTSFCLYAQPSLTDEIHKADAQFFTAFNECDIDTMSSMLSQDLEFYHDIAGVSDHKSTMQVTQSNCERKLGLNRTLIPESLKIYPIKAFGAIQLGEHQFCHWENGKNDCGTFGFTHVWKKTSAGWKITRVISYDH